MTNNDTRSLEPDDFGPLRRMWKRQDCGFGCGHDCLVSEAITGEEIELRLQIIKCMPHLLEIADAYAQPKPTAQPAGADVDVEKIIKDREELETECEELEKSVLEEIRNSHHLAVQLADAQREVAELKEQLGTVRELRELEVAGNRAVQKALHDYDQTQLADAQREVETMREAGNNLQEWLLERQSYHPAELDIPDDIWQPFCNALDNAQPQEADNESV